MLENGLTVFDVAEATGSAERSVQKWKARDGIPAPKFELLKFKVEKK